MLWCWSTYSPSSQPQYTNNSQANSKDTPSIYLQARSAGMIYAEYLSAPSYPKVKNYCISQLHASTDR